MYDLTRDNLLLGMHEVGYTFSVCLMDSGCCFMVFCWGMNFCYPVFRSCRSRFEWTGNGSCWSVTHSTMAWYSAPRKFCPVWCCTCWPSPYTASAASWLPAYTKVFTPALGVTEWPYPHFTEEETEAWKFRKSPRLHRQGICWLQLPHSVFMVNFSACMTLIITYKFSSK